MIAEYRSRRIFRERPGQIDSRLFDQGLAGRQSISFGEPSPSASSNFTSVANTADAIARSVIERSHRRHRLLVVNVGEQCSVSHAQRAQTMRAPNGRTTVLSGKWSALILVW